MSAVEILATGAHADAIPAESPWPTFSRASNGVSTPVDTSAHAVLRLDLTLTANLGASPDVRLFIEHGPAAEGPWSVLVEKHFTRDSWGQSRRVVLASFDAFMRLRWAAKAESNSALNLELGLS